MHWAVVGGAASMGKRRPGPISTHREDRREGADLDTRSEKRPNPNVAREKKETHTRTNTTTLQQSEKGDKKE